MVRDYNHKEKFKKSVIVEKLTPVTYSVKTYDDLNWKRHVDQIIPCKLDISKDEEKPDTVITPGEILLKREENACENVIKDDKAAKEKVKVNGKAEQPVRRSSRTPKPRKILDL